MINFELISSLSKSEHHSHQTPNIFGDIKILCPSGQPGYAYCLEYDNCSVVCKDQEHCPCYKNHKNCENIKRITMFNGNLQNQTRSPKILDNITKISQQMIDNISQLEQSIRQKFLIFGLNRADQEIVNKIRKYAIEKSPLVSKDLRQYKDKYQGSEKQWFAKQNERFQNLLQSSRKFLIDQLSKMREIIYYEHMENSKNPTQIMFQNSSTLKGDQKFKNRLIQMLKQLGKLSKAQKIFTIKEHNFTLGKFYQNCTSRKQLLYIVKNSTDRIYGAYSPVQIEGVSGKTYDDLQKKTFIFDLEENEKSKIEKTQKVLTVYPSNSQEKNNPQKVLMKMGNAQYPNFIIAEDSASTQRLNYVCFGSKDQKQVYFQKRPSKMIDSTSKRKYTLKQFEVFELTFK